MAGTNARNCQPRRKGTKTTADTNTNVNATPDIPIDPILTMPKGPNDVQPVVPPIVPPAVQPINVVQPQVGPLSVNDFMAAQMRKMEGQF